MTWAIVLLGCSGLVIEVGLENLGLARSTRLPAGASGRQPPPWSGRMQLGPGGRVAAGVALRALDDRPDPSHPPAASRARARPTASSVAPGRPFGPGRRAGLLR